VLDCDTVGALSKQLCSAVVSMQVENYVFHGCAHVHPFRYRLLYTGTLHERESYSVNFCVPSFGPTLDSAHWQVVQWDDWHALSKVNGNWQCELWWRYVETI